MDLNIQKKIPSQVVTRAWGLYLATPNSNHLTTAGLWVCSVSKASSCKCAAELHGWWMTLPDRRPTIGVMPTGGLHSHHTATFLTPTFFQQASKKTWQLHHTIQRPMATPHKNQRAFPTFNCAKAESARAWHDAAMLAHATLNGWWMRQVSYSSYRWEWEWESEPVDSMELKGSVNNANNVICMDEATMSHWQWSCEFKQEN